jgi:hypothetical protein
MHAGKIAQADQQLVEVEAKIAELADQSAEHRKLKSLQNKATRLRKQLDRKLAQATKNTASSRAAPLAEKKTTSTKLTGGVKKRLKDIDAFLNRAERYAATDAKNANYKLQQAAELFAEIDRMYAGQFDPAHADYVRVKNRYDNLLGKTEAQGVAEAKAIVAAEVAREAKEKQSAEWLGKFRAFLSYSGQEGHDPDRLVFVPGTSEPDKFAEAQRRYREFKAFYAEFRKVEFPDGKTWALQDLADNVAPRRLADFESSFSDRLASVYGDAENSIRNAMQQLEKDNGWMHDESLKPPIVDSRTMDSIRASVERVTSALGDDPKAKVIQEKYAALLAKDQANRKTRAERTLLFADIYRQADATELKELATAIVVKQRPGSRVLRVSLYKDDWTQETVEEWTDTSRTQWRIRTTRMLNAQVAAKQSSGVFMHTLHIAQDKMSGSWGRLYGHIMWSEPMLESNVQKNGVNR